MRKLIKSAGDDIEVHLNEWEIMSDPFDQFISWYEQTKSAGTIEPNAMNLATSSLDGQPSVRMVLLKSFDMDGIVFFTNYRSRKGRELNQHPYAALVFWWDVLERQVRVEGKVEKITLLESQEYNSSRPRGNQLVAHVSRQSEVISDRAILEKRWMEIEKRYHDREIPKPPGWGDFRIKPTVIEFWQGRTHHLHDRLRYALQKDSSWKIERLSP